MSALRDVMLFAKDMSCSVVNSSTCRDACGHRYENGSVRYDRIGAGSVLSIPLMSVLMPTPASVGLMRLCLVSY